MLSVRSLVRLVVLTFTAVLGAAALPQRAKAQVGPCQSPDGILYTISPCNPSISQLATTTITVAESLYVNGGNSTPGTFSCTASGVVTSCTVSPTTFVNGGSEIDSIKVTGILGNSAGTGSITVTATGPTAIAQTVISVTALPTVTVAAEYGPNDWYDSSQVSITNHRFLITNHTAGSLTYNVTLTGCSAAACTLRNGSSVTVPANGTGFDSVTYNSGNLGQTFTGTFTATQTTNSTQTASVTVTQHAALDRVKGVIVHTLTDHGNIRTGADTTQFSVTNKSRFSAGVNLTPTCSGPAFTGTCTVSPASPITVPANGTSTVSVISTGSSTTGATGYVKLVVTPPTYTGGADSAITDVTVTAQPAPGIALTTRGVNFDNGNCLEAAIQRAVAYACGDLRIAHALPAAWTYNKKRQLVLIYRAQTARPWAVERGLVTLDPTKGTPDSVTAQLVGTGFSGKYVNTDFANGATRQVALWTYFSHNLEPEAFNDGGGLTLQVNAYYGATNIAYSALDPALIDIRDTSKIGPGWGIAGLEYLRIQPQTGGPPNWFWYGADGSIHDYGAVNLGGGVIKWVAAALDRPDTIIRVVQQPSGQVTFVRLAQHGVRVVFDSATGHHIQTIDRLGHMTQFFYHAGTYMDLDSMTVAAPGGRHLTWQFTYGSDGYLQSISGPPVTGQSRTVTFTRNSTSHVLTKITDPDGTSDSFNYSAYDRPSDPGIVVAYTDKRGTVTTFTYDSTYFLRQAVVDTGQGHLNLTVKFTPAETRGLGIVGQVTSSAAPDSIYTLIDGPRSGVNIGKFWINGFGEPLRIRDALGYETVISYGDSRWPVLPTRVRYASGQVVSATYNARGNGATFTDSSTFLTTGGVTRYATDSAMWNQKFDFVTRTVSAMGLVSWVDLDTLTGNRTGQMTFPDTIGPDSVYWIRFAYDPVTQLVQAISTTQTAPAVSQYDTLGNLSSETTSRGYWSSFVRDQIGRDTLIISNIDSTDFAIYNPSDGFHHKFSRKQFDAADRIIATSDSSVDMSLYEPCHGGSFTAHGLALNVLTTYNNDGTPQSVERWSSPDYPGIGHAITQYHYDALGRKIVEIQPDGTRDSTVLDLAGDPLVHVTRRHFVLTATYDALNRRISAIIPASTKHDTSTAEFGFYPRYADNGDGRGELAANTSDSLAAPADTQTFTYDAAGRFRTAFNREAHVSRTYNPNGTLATDTLAIRTYTGVDFLTHVYGLSFSYDLDGRRTAIHQPLNLAFTPTDSESYAYDAQRGNVYSATDVRGNWFQYLDDPIGRLTSLAYFEHGNNQSVSAETFSYDGDSWMLGHSDFLTLADGSDTGWTNHQLRADTNSHDGRGKVMNIFLHQGQLAHAEKIRNRYDGLGQLAVYKRTLVNSDGSEDDEGPIQDLKYNAADAFGNEGSVNVCLSNGNGMDRTYQAASGRITFQRWVDDANPFTESVAHEWDNYDSTGNLEFQRRDGGFERGATNSVEDDETTSFIAANDRVTYVDRRNNYGVYADSSNVNELTFYKVYFDEYRYDALGRRIMRRSRANSNCLAYNCYSMIQRFVWDGDDLLWEISRPGWDTVSVANLEADTVTVQPDSRFYGRVLYLNGLSVDRPLDVIRYGLSYPYSGNRSHLWSPLVIVPHYNWQDQPDWISFESGQQYTCQPAPNHDECATYRLPDATNAFLHNGTWPTASWLGTTLNGTTENQGSGLQYKRNRFYDPVNSTFTQEDPIGLAGGFNAYGFAGGDPVSYRDPQGTCGPACFIVISAIAGAAIYGGFKAYEIYSHGGALTWGTVGSIAGASLTGAVAGANLASGLVGLGQMTGVIATAAEPAATVTAGAVSAAPEEGQGAKIAQQIMQDAADAGKAGDPTTLIRMARSQVAALNLSQAEGVTVMRVTLTKLASQGVEFTENSELVDGVHWFASRVPVPTPAGMTGPVFGGTGITSSGQVIKGLLRLLPDGKPFLPVPTP